MSKYINICYDAHISTNTVTAVTHETILYVCVQYFEGKKDEISIIAEKTAPHSIKRD